MGKKKKPDLTQQMAKSVIGALERQGYTTKSQRKKKLKDIVKEVREVKEDLNEVVEKVTDFLVDVLDEIDEFVSDIIDEITK